MAELCVVGTKRLSSSWSHGDVSLCPKCPSVLNSSATCCLQCVLFIKGTGPRRHRNPRPKIYPASPKVLTHRLNSICKTQTTSYHKRGCVIRILRSVLFLTDVKGKFWFSVSRFFRTNIYPHTSVFCEPHPTLPGTVTP